MSEKIKTYDEIEEISKAMKAEGKRVGFVTGSFDLMHPGHCRYLQACKKECDFLIAAVSADAAITKRKGEMRPHNPQADRAELIANLEYPALDINKLPNGFSNTV